jgi:hypothetical protein
MARKKKMTYCPRCWGYDKLTCLMCRYIQIDDIKERRKYLAELWLKGRKFLMTTFAFNKDRPDDPGPLTGLEDVVREEFGPWMTTDRQRCSIPEDIKKLMADVL